MGKSQTLRKIQFRYEDLEHGRDEVGFDTPREFIAYLFRDKHKVRVINFDELKYFYHEWGIIVEGDLGRSLLTE